MRTPIIFVLLCAPLLMAASMNVTYDIHEREVHVTYDVLLVQESITLILPQDAREVTIDGTLGADTRITLQGTGRSRLSYITSSLTEGSRHPYFIADLSRLPAELEDVRVLLPARAVLDKPLTDPSPSVHPRPTSTSTDGERIQFMWSGAALEPSRALFIKYDPVPQLHSMFFVAIALAVVALVIAFVSNRLSRRVNEKTMNLYGAEKNIVHVLLDAPEDGLWQNDLVAKSGLTKVKVSRKLRSLEQKGVIEKIPHGNTNRIRLK